MKKWLCAVLAACMLAAALPLAGCGSSYSPNAVVIYAEFNGAAGTEDAAVKEAIEQKFFADTGFEIDLQVETAGTDMIGQRIIAAMADGTARIDALSMHYGADSPIDSYILDGLTMDLAQLAEEYAPDYLASFSPQNDPGGLAYNSGVLEGKLYGLSGKMRNSGWGMLIRRDYMEQTDYDPDDYDITVEGHKSLTVDQFVDLARQMRENTDADRPIVGKTWSLDYFLAPPLGAVGYNEKVTDGEGNVIPAYADESYRDVLELYRMLQEEKLWIENPANAQNLLSYFVSGRGGIYMDWPEVTSQLDVARALKEATGVDCIVIEPLLTEGGDGVSQTNGNLRVRTAFSGLAVPLKAKNVELLLRYINWLYADKENYELAMYGVEGEHWVASSDENGEYWDYPADKKEQYMRAAPYSGKYCLLEDYHISDRLFAGYTQKEREIVQKVRAFAHYPSGGYLTEGMMLPSVPDTDRELRNIETAHYNEYTTVRSYAWSDAAIPNGQTVASLWQTMHDNLYGQYSALLDYYTETYNQAKNALS